MLQVAMINNHRPLTPAGVCLTGNTLRCPECNRVGALDGYTVAGSVALCCKCGHGYPKKTGGAVMKQRSVPVLVDREDIRSRLKNYKKTNHLQWRMVVILLNSTSKELNYTVKRLGVACSPSSSAGAAYMQRLAQALDALEAQESF